MRKLVSLIMAMVMLLSFSSGVLAEVVILNSYSEYDDVELLKEVISNMNEYEKSLFFEMIQSSVEEQQFYRDNIDNNYRVNYKTNIKSDNIDINSINGVYRAARSNKDASIRNAINTFNAGIVTLGLSKTAVMLFKATAVSLGAAIADGPLPAGDALFIITGTLTVAYLAANWKEIGPKWNSIDRLFKTSFSMASYAIGQAMRDLKAKVLDKVSEKSEDRKSEGEISDSTEKEVKRKLGSEALKKFKEAVKKGLVGSTNESGIKRLKGKGIQIGRTYYEYELKILGKYGDFRLLGNKDPRGKIIFTILTDHKYKKM
ncbi:hypothetical protein RBU61_18330 [Tissierella sp. MB52-C2]|uniref:hypothetical protein n=1 Tax=Tissierella sp. MB52-C2 TaxID=3070999 RepID=UPI00280B020D|nr:hypothetical protein [Tissierella sp. MB52-C2]WMM24860.1 hypothetical protein RBU61_18330 [Tissierella sp. MB52-C2]